MAFRSAIWPIASSLSLFSLGAAGLAACRYGLWGTALGAALAAGWILAVGIWRAIRRDLPSIPALEHRDGAAAPPYPLVLDQLSVPLVDIRGEQASALNRAARALFATDDRILPPPTALIGPGTPHLLHGGWRYRIDRIEMGGRTIAALIDVEAEQRTAEARATAEMIQVLGHELLNGLAPIVSLAESGVAAIDGPAQRYDLLPEILGTLSRRAEGLLRFSEAYRRMARLPDPVRKPVAIGTVTDDLVRLFAGCWDGKVALEIDRRQDLAILIDGEQVTQGVWALLQNGAEAALSASAAGGPAVSLSIRWSTDRLQIDVGDNGDGISPADAVRIFRPFHTTKPGGTGVGLSIARQIALAHGGDLVLLDMKPPVFRMDIPCRQSHELGVRTI